MPKSQIWKFPNYLSASDDFKRYLFANWAHYVDDNLEHLEDIALFCLTSKAVMRVHIISYLKFKEKECCKHFDALNTDLTAAY